MREDGTSGASDSEAIILAQMQDRPTTYPKAKKGPLPAPDWLVTATDATDRVVSELKAGKEAEVALFERTSQQDGRSVLLAAKQLIDINLRDFRKDHEYREGRKKADKRQTRALESRSRYGKVVKAFEWAHHEFLTACSLWEAGVPVPYPVSFDNVEFVMEFIGDHDEALAAPRLIDVAPQLSKGELEAIWEQLADGILKMSGAGVVHADLSAYNVLLWGDIKIIDFPQAVNPTVNSSAVDFLERDIGTLSVWFRKRGVHIPGRALFNECKALFQEDE
jgi:RIO kinase 1